MRFADELTKSSRICIATIMRIIALIQLDADISYSIVSAKIWSSLEPCLGIVNACLPVLQPAVAKFSSTAFEWTRRLSEASTAKDKSWPGSFITRPLHLEDSNIDSSHQRRYKICLLEDNKTNFYDLKGACLNRNIASALEDVEAQQLPVSPGNTTVLWGWDVHGNSIPCATH